MTHEFLPIRIHWQWHPPDYILRKKWRSESASSLRFCAKSDVIWAQWSRAPMFILGDRYDLKFNLIMWQEHSNRGQGRAEGANLHIWGQVWLSPTDWISTTYWKVESHCGRGTVTVRSFLRQIHPIAVQKLHIVKGSAPFPQKANSCQPSILEI